MFSTARHRREASALAHAVAELGRGDLVAFPTETVYGLGADAANAEAVAKIFALKGRPADHPLIVHVADADALDDWAATFPTRRARWPRAFWPGPLTLILRARRACSTSSPAGRTRSACAARRIPWRWRCCASSRASAAARHRRAVGQPLRPREPDHRAARARRIRRRTCWCSTAAPARSASSRRSSISRAARRCCCGPARVAREQIEACSASAAATATRRRRAPRARSPRTTRPRRRWSSSRPGSARRRRSREAAARRACSLSRRPVPRAAAASASRAPREPGRVRATTSTPTCARSTRSGADVILVEAPPRTPAWEAVNDRLARAASGREANR